jgi:hypothetical protein
MDAQSAVGGDHAGVEGHVVTGTGGQAVARIKPLSSGRTAHGRQRPQGGAGKLPTSLALYLPTTPRPIAILR